MGKKINKQLEKLVHENQVLSIRDLDRRHSGKYLQRIISLKNVYNKNFQRIRLLLLLLNPLFVARKFINLYRTSKEIRESQEENKITTLRLTERIDTLESVINNKNKK